MSQISKGKVLDAAELFYDSDTGKLLEAYERRAGSYKRVCLASQAAHINDSPEPRGASTIRRRVTKQVGAQSPLGSTIFLVRGIGFRDPAAGVSCTSGSPGIGGTWPHGYGPPESVGMAVQAESRAALDSTAASTRWTPSASAKDGVG